MTKQKPRQSHNHPGLFIILTLICAAGKTFFADSVKNSLKQVDFEIMTAEEMFFDLIQEIAVRMDEIAAHFAFQMEMIPAFYRVYVLVTGAFALIQHIFADLSPGRQFLQMPVDSGLPNDLFRIRKMARYLIDRDMGSPKGLHVIKDTLPLAGMIICRTFCHRPIVP
jgi:hypothetical protein